MDNKEAKEAAQALIDRKLTEEITAYKAQFLGFYEAYCRSKNIIVKPDDYTFSPFELFTIDRLANMKVAMDNQTVRISNEVKTILNEFIDKVNEVAEDEVGETDG